MRDKVNAVVTKRSDEHVVVGKIGAPYGIKGWVKVHSFTESQGDVFSYSPWMLENGHNQHEVSVTDGKVHGKGLVAKLEGYDTPEQVRVLTGSLIHVEQAQLPTLKEGEYYWKDLEGLTVINQDGKDLGKVLYVLETGSNDVLIVKHSKEHAIPYLPGTVVLSVDLTQRIMRVNWEEI